MSSPYASFDKDNQLIHFAYPTICDNGIFANPVITTGQFMGNVSDSSFVPSYTWTDDTNTGMFHAGTRTIAFATNAVERLRITSTGNVGIGTTNPKPGFTLHTEGFSLMYPQITIIEEQVASSGTNVSYAPATIGNNTWVTRKLNTITTNFIGIGALSGNNFILPQGTYIIQADAPAGNMAAHRIGLYNVTGGVMAAYGSTESSATKTTDQFAVVCTRSSLYTIVTVNTPTTFRIDHFSTAATGSVTFGYSTNASGANDVFARVIIIRCQ